LGEFYAPVRGRPGGDGDGDGGLSGDSDGGGGGTTAGGGASSGGHARGCGAAGNDEDDADDDENDGCLFVDAAPAAADAVSVVRLASVGWWSAGRELGFSLSALDLQHTSRGSRRRRVVRIPDPRLRLETLERPGRVLVDCTTAFVGTVEVSPYVSHYQYLPDLLSLYCVALDSASGGEGVASASVATARRGGAPAGSGGARQWADDGAVGAGAGAARRRLRPRRRARAVGGPIRGVRRLVLEPRLQHLGELTPSLETVLSWIGVDGAEAVAAGL